MAKIIAIQVAASAWYGGVYITPVHNGTYDATNEAIQVARLLYEVTPSTTFDAFCKLLAARLGISDVRIDLALSALAESNVEDEAGE